MALTRDEKETLTKGFLQLGISVILYLTFTILGFLTAYSVGFILPEFIVGYIQGTIVILTQSLGGYFTVKTLQSETSVE